MGRRRTVSPPAKENVDFTILRYDRGPDAPDRIARRRPPDIRPLQRRMLRHGNKDTVGAHPAEADSRPDCRVARAEQRGNSGLMLRNNGGGQRHMLV